MTSGTRSPTGSLSAEAVDLPAQVALTAKEQAQWMLHRLAPERGVCNVVAAVRVAGPLRWWPLQEALNRVIYRHPALRVVLTAGGGLPHKRFLPPDTVFPLTTVASTEAELDALLTELTAEPLDLHRGPLVRAHLVLLPEASVLCLTLHHLVGDLVTIQVLLAEVAELYQSYSDTGEPSPRLTPAATVHLEPNPRPGSVGYWREHLAGFDPAGMELAGSRPIPSRPTFAGERVTRRLPEDVAAAALRLARLTGLTHNLALLSAFYLLLIRHGASADAVVGVPVDARTSAPADVVGFHVNTLPIRVHVDQDVDFAALTREVSRSFFSGIEHSDAPFEAVQADLPRRSSDWRVPVFRHMFNYRPELPASRNPAADSETVSLAGSPLRRMDVHNGVSRLDLEWIVAPGPDGVHLTVVYSTEVHERSMVEEMISRYEALLLDAADLPERPIRQLYGLPPADRVAHRRLNATAGPRHRGSALVEILTRARQAPEANAMRYRRQPVSYRELLGMADTVRRRLLDCGLRPGETVALCAPRGPGLAAAALGVWAGGGTYLPLDPRHPAARLTAQLDDADVGQVISSGDVVSGVFGGRKTHALPTPGALGTDLDRWPLPDPAASAYIIYTSGSTGAPKGVEVSHASLANLIHDFAARLAVKPSHRTLWLTTFAFDISALELFLPLASGGTVVVAETEHETDPDRLLAHIEAEDVTVVQATPTTWHHVSGSLRGQLAGRRVLCGGEQLTAALAGRLLADGCRLSNVYGPTETTVWSTVADLTGPVEDPVSLGFPIANTTAHVECPGGGPAPPGVPGELYIAGAGVAIGYRGKPELTAERFPELPGLGRVYRTGDRVRWSADGIEFLGRLDRQVKVRGHRIELDEVETVLERHPAVRQAAALTESDREGHHRLLAVVELQDQVQNQGDERQQSAADLVVELRSLATAHLPPGAVPSRYVTLPLLPRTANGKLDRRALAKAASAPAPGGRLPDDPVQQCLLKLWRSTLGDDQIGPDADFFLHGGHSLLAVALARSVTAELGFDVEFDAVFEAPTPEQFAELVRARRGER